MPKNCIARWLNGLATGRFFPRFTRQSHFPMNSTSLFLALFIGAALFIGVWAWQNNVARNAAESEQNAQVEQGFLTTRKEFNDKLEDIKQRREEIVVQIDRLEERKKATGQKLKDALAGPERQIILQVLEANNWNRNTTAEVLGINRTTLYKKMKRLGLDDSYRAAIRSE